ncbi:ABC transporter ATP-binding protein [Candidatus Albibeggiatoa sp. nov. NOAA]|uniref:metal ABC transporter ATP-binding protein n=1 Tax=Candidatus Albibeggiatoa sp. nov. NOAA TaxID=3162724 RepID=UPI0032FBFE3F|nr:ABC transporter ATP-binding protein [Thiotrichaceae bacterium]
MTTAIQLDNVSFAYDAPTILENINLTIEIKEFLGIVGPNGGGKSTLLKIMLGLLKPTQGQALVFGESPAKQRINIGYVPQFANFPRHFPITVQETVLTGRLGVTRSWLGFSREDKAIAHEAMQTTHIADLAKRQIGQLSGGQLQRVLIARALACQPKILILDEPTANIDQRVEEDIFDLLKQLNQELTVIVVSHDIGFISAYVSRVACLNKTLLCHQTAPVTPQELEQLYHIPVRAIQHQHY